MATMKKTSSNSSLFFQPEDFDSVVTLDFLSEMCTNMVLDIRNGANGKKYNILKKNIELLNTYANDVDLVSKDKAALKSNSVNKLFQIYEQAKTISMQLRSILSTNGINLQNYESIEYALYYNGTRYMTENINVSKWVTIGSNGELRLMLDKAVADIKKQISNQDYSLIQEAFNIHYTNYKNIIQGEYKGGSIGHSRLNWGHVTEAYESHLASHHSVAYQYLNSNAFKEEPSAIDKIVLAEIENQGQWSTHESSTEAWIHIRGALGTQRGTVAGDVGKFQVKSGSDKSEWSNQVRLASVSTLRNAVNIYSGVLNSSIPAATIGLQMAKYLSERVGTNDKNLQAYAANKKISEEFDDVKEDLKSMKLVHI